MESNSANRFKLGQRIAELQLKTNRMLKNAANCRCCDSKMGHVKHPAKEDRKSCSVVPVTPNLDLPKPILAKDSSKGGAKVGAVQGEGTSPKSTEKRLKSVANQNLSRFSLNKSKILTKTPEKDTKLKGFLDEILTKARQKKEDSNITALAVMTAKLEDLKAKISQTKTPPLRPASTEEKGDIRTVLKRFLGAKQQGAETPKKRVRVDSGGFSEALADTRASRGSDSLATTGAGFADVNGKRGSARLIELLGSNYGISKIEQMRQRMTFLETKRIIDPVFKFLQPLNWIQRFKDKNEKDAKIGSISAEIDQKTAELFDVLRVNFLVAVENERVQRNLAILAEIFGAEGAIIDSQ